MNNYSASTGIVWRNSSFRKTSDFYAGRHEFRINSKFYNTLVVPEGTVLPLADRWDRAHCQSLLLPLALSSSSLSRAFPAFSTGDV